MNPRTFQVVQKLEDLKALTSDVKNQIEEDEYDEFLNLIPKPKKFLIYDEFWRTSGARRTREHIIKMREMFKNYRN